MNSLGSVGVDKIRISGFSHPNNGRYDEPVILHLVQDPLKLIEIQKKDNITMNNHMASIREDSFTFTWGNCRGKSYSYIQVSASDINKNNLYNMSIKDIAQKIDEAIKILHDKYGITFVNYNYANLTVTKIEINVTFETQYPFKDYADILSLYGYLMRTDSKNKSFASYGTDRQNNQEIETLYLCKKSNYSLKAYDKGAELKSKGIQNISANKHYMRLELTVDKICELTNSNNKILLSLLSDDDIKKYFRRRIWPVKVAADNYYNDNLQKGYNGEVSIEKLLMDSLLSYSVYEKSAYQIFFKNLIILESKIKLPYVRSLNDLYVVIGSNSFLSDDFKIICERMINDQYQEDENVKEILNRKKLEDEIISNIFEGYDKHIG